MMLLHITARSSLTLTISKVHGIMELILFGLTVALHLKDTHTQGIQMKTFGTGNNVSLLCSNRRWNELILVRWEVKRRDGSDCFVALEFKNITRDSTCDSRITIQQRGDGVVLQISPFNSSDEGNYTCETVSLHGPEAAHFNVKAESNVNTSEAKHHRPSPAGTVIWSVCGSVALLTLIVLSSVIIRRKLQRKGRKKPGTTERVMFSTEEVQKQKLTVITNGFEF
ncbi:uncharacterized protein LOC118222515 isoform X1 [Anguilla anguilla]|uniref:uncharacterized protein LOC118222515 isoform X1 n=1 Tax=Anguilla anguilla TaxID=7936 RepID=UPI0015B36E95|nr:uncharacterized protein LOC118222515 isoform X1 [Anguilla anguilla]